MLKDAVQAIYNKVATDLTSASPEELAYLSTSLEKLGGRATVYDVMDMGEDYKTQLQTLANSLLAGINTDVSGISTQFETDVQAIVALETTNFNNMITEVQLQYDTLLATTEDSLNTTIANIQADVSQAESDIAMATSALTDAAAIANQQAINGSFFNLYFYGTMQVS